MLQVQPSPFWPVTLSKLYNCSRLFTPYLNLFKLYFILIFNPFNARCSKLLLLEGFSAILDPAFLIFDIRALWRSVLSARAPECQKLKMLGQASMAMCKALRESALKGLNWLMCSSLDLDLVGRDLQSTLLMLMRYVIYYLLTVTDQCESRPDLDSQVGLESMFLRT